MSEAGKAANMLGAAWPLALAGVGVALLSGMDAAIKAATESAHVLAVTLGRYVFGAAFALAIWNHAGRPSISAEMWRAHGVRGVVIAMSATSFFWAISVLPLAEAVTIGFVAPLLVPPVARLMIGERMRAINIVAALVGFAGVLIAMQGAPPASEAPQRGLGTAAVLFSAVTYAVSLTLMRARAQRDGAPIVNLMASFVPAVIVAAPTMMVAPPPPSHAYGLMALIGLLGACGMYLMARAYAAAEAQSLAPLQYTELIWAGVYGYLLFNETPRPEVISGAAVIVAACALLAWDERRRGRVRPA